MTGNKKKIPLYSLLTIMSVALVLASVVIVAAVLTGRSKDLITQSTVSGVERTARSVKISVDDRIDSAAATLDVVKSKLTVSDAAFSEVALSAVTLDENFDSVIVYDGNGEILKCVSDKTLKSTRSVNLSDFRKNATEGVYYFSPLHVQTLFSGEYPWVVTVCTAVKGTVYGDVYLSADVTLSSIFKIIDETKIGNRGYCYIVGNDGEIVYHPRRQLIQSGVDSLDDVSLTSDGVQMSGEKAYVVLSVENTGWKIVALNYPGELSDVYAQKTVRTIVVSSVSAIALACIIAVLVSRHISKPISTVASEMEKFEKDVYGYRCDDGFSSVISEADSLFTAFKVNVTVVQQLLKEVEEKQREVTKSQLETLRNQINPHFLYNTLDSVLWMCKVGKNDEAAEMISALAKLLRIGVSRGKRIVLIAKELEHAESYLKIQSMRFGGKFTYKFDVDSEVLSARCNKIILQPFIENAIKHAMIEGDVLNITISGKIENDKVLLKVIDDGCGIPADKLDEIRNGTLESLGIGIGNVDSRIKMCFGEEYGVTIDSVEDEGCAVTITLPLDAKEVYDE